MTSASGRTTLYRCSKRLPHKEGRRRFHDADREGSRGKELALLLTDERVARRAGWIPLSRELIEARRKAGGRYSKLEATLDVLARAAWREHTTSHGVELEVGEFVVSLEHFARAWNWSKSAVRWHLKSLREDGVLHDTITTQPAARSRHIQRLANSTLALWQRHGNDTANDTDNALSREHEHGNTNTAEGGTAPAPAPKKRAKKRASKRSTRHAVATVDEPEIPAEIDGPDFRESWQEWLDWRAGSEWGPLKVPTAKATLRVLAEKFNEREAVGRLQEALVGGWRGCVWKDTPAGLSKTSGATPEPAEGDDRWSFTE